MTRDEAVALVQRVMKADYGSGQETDRVRAALGRALGCPQGYVSGLIVWSAGGGLTAEQAVDQALASRPIAL